MPEALNLGVVGGSSASTPELIDALDEWPASSARPPIRLVLIGRSADKLDSVAAACRARLPADGAPISVETATDRVAGMRGCNVILNQSRAGGLVARDFDESFPQLVGLPGEETMGPGGLANALRTVPAMASVWHDIETAAPHSLVLNLTNPAGIVVAAAQRSTSLRVIALCDGPVTFLDTVADRLGAARAEIRARYLGLNHVGWYVPRTPAELDELADLSLGIDPGYIAASGALPFTYVRYYAHPDRILRQQLGQPTRASQLQERERQLLDSYRAGVPVELPRRALWYRGIIVPFLAAWANGTSEPMVVGVRNGDLVAWLPADAVVEVAHTVQAGGTVSAVAPPDLPALPAALLGAHAAYERLAVDAATASDGRVPVLRALLANPMVRGYEQAVALADALIASPTS